MFVLRKIWRALFSCNHRFEIHLFALLPTSLKVFKFHETAMFIRLQYKNQKEWNSKTSARVWEHVTTVTRLLKSNWYLLRGKSHIHVISQAIVTAFLSLSFFFFAVATGWRLCHPFTDHCNNNSWASNVTIWTYWAKQNTWINFILKTFKKMLSLSIHYISSF